MLRAHLETGVASERRNIFAAQSVMITAYQSDAIMAKTSRSPSLNNDLTRPPAE
jgi:hypothetical protein